MTNPSGRTGRAVAASLATAALLAATGARAQAPLPWQMGLQAAHSPVQRDVVALNDFLLYVIIAIVVFVAGLLFWVVVRYNAKANPVPSRTTHNTLVEVVWTVAPVLILVAIAIPSLKLVYFEDHTLTPDMTVKVTGHQWYWEYTYPDRGGVDFTSYMVPGNKLPANMKDFRQLAVDNALVVPTGKNIRVLITSGDVLHAWFVPSLGVQRYAIPGRVVETWFNVDKPGDYYGECNQICGINHDAMSIDVHAVTPAQFEVWLKSAKDKYSALTTSQRFALLDAPTR